MCVRWREGRRSDAWAERSLKMINALKLELCVPDDDDDEPTFAVSWSLSLKEEESNDNE